MAGEKFNLQLEAVEILNRLNQVPGLAQGLSNLLQNFNAHNHDLKYQLIGDYANAVHTHMAEQVTEQANKRFLTDAERSTISSAALKDFSNVTSQSLGQNGYCKFPNGLMIQWGYSSSSGSEKTIFLPISFYDINYSVATNVISLVDLSVMFSIYIRKGKTASSFSVKNRYDSVSGDAGDAQEPFNWIAIGRWK